MIVTDSQPCAKCGALMVIRDSVLACVVCAPARTPFDAVREDGHIAQPGAYYATLYPKLREVAYQYGYALAIHGSLNKDLDLIAIPWTEEAKAEEALVVALCDRAHGLITPGQNPTLKPHGRHAWTIHLPGAGGYIDLGVMPRMGA